jgi:YgiT-type zinc finger domain-containing protein
MNCPVCGSSNVRMEKILYRNQYIQFGELHDFEVPNIPAIICEDCGEVSIPGESEDLIDDYLLKEDCNTYTIYKKCQE